MQGKGLLHLMLSLCSLIVAETTVTLENNTNGVIDNNNSSYQMTNQSNFTEQCFLCTQGQVSDAIKSRNLSHLFKGDVARLCLFR